MILYSALNHGSSSVRFGVEILFIHMHLNSHCFLLLSYSNINNVRWCERWERREEGTATYERDAAGGAHHHKISVAGGVTRESLGPTALGWIGTVLGCCPYHGHLALPSR
jgi:hypothetical protein